MNQVLWVFEWVIKQHFSDGGNQGPYYPYKLCYFNLYIEINIFPHIDNLQ